MDLIDRSLSPYTAPIIVVPHKAPPGSSFTKTERLVIDYHDLNQQLPKIQTAQAKSKVSIALIKTAKIEYIRAKLRGEKYFSSLDIRSGYIILPYSQSQDQRQHLFAPTVSSSGKELVMEFPMLLVFSYLHCLNSYLSTWMTYDILCRLCDCL